MVDWGAIILEGEKKSLFFCFGFIEQHHDKINGKPDYYIRGGEPTPVVTPVVRQAGQLFLPVCSHSSTQDLWKA